MRFLFLFLALGALQARAADLAPAGAPANVPGVYQQFVAPPTRVPTPAPQRAYSGARIEIYKETFGFNLKGGAAVPLGDMAKNNLAGWSAGFDAVYGASPMIDAAFGMTYASMPYKLTTAAQAHTSMGVGLKAIVKAFNQGKLRINLQGGLGYYFEHVAEEVNVRPDPSDPNKLLYDVGYKSSAGIGFDLGAALGFQFTPNFGLMASADAVQVSVGGGTSDTPLYLTPSLNISYTF